LGIAKLAKKNWLFAFNPGRSEILLITDAAEAMRAISQLRHH
jgi:hypothetical protein